MCVYEVGWMNFDKDDYDRGCFKETFQHWNCWGKLVFQYMPQIKHFNLGRGVLVKNRLPVSPVLKSPGPRWFGTEMTLNPFGEPEPRQLNKHSF